MQFGLMGPEEPDENLISRGCITVQFSFHMSELSLMEYENERRVRRVNAGAFTLKTIRQINAPILAQICCVDKFKWPLTKDTVILRVTARTFVIALPGLLYALQFPGLCDRERLRILSYHFRESGHYRDLRKLKLGGYSQECNTPGMLEMLRPHFEPIAHEALLEVGHIPGISRFCMREQNSSFLRACRMSVMTKVIMESMRVKMMTTSLVDIHDPDPDPPEEEQLPTRACAAASTYTRLVDAAEYACLVCCGLGERLENVESPLRFASVDIGFKVWNLNEIGLLTFMSRFEADVKEEVEYVTAQEKWWNDMEKRVEGRGSARGRDVGNSSQG
ncbi:hypothetical protein DEO72_LG6g3403 [Vigna unguiculata]|uniref:Uncharacterized protein n=1 Tax=Vigna unguiculata TaxID=3917 RepID=A0A4D6MDZ9_VIGUN|nr:hypothetical protein DEO72_LG6g3403 [Vigna unguiculata]